MQKIAHILNAEGVPSKYGKQWYSTTVEYVLKNPIYKGFIRYGKAEKGIHEKINIFK